MKWSSRVAGRQISQARLFFMGCLLSGGLVYPAAAADRVVTLSTSLLGEVVSMTPDALEFREQGSAGRPRQIPVDEIVSLVLESEPPRVTEARQLLEQDDFQAAATVLAEVSQVELDVASAAARGEHAYVKAAVAGRQALASGSDSDGGMAAVTDFLDRFSRSIHRYEMIELAGDLELAMGKQEAALSRYRQLAKGPQSLAIRAARREGETLLEMGRAAEAAAVLAAAADLPAGNAASRRERTATKIGEANCLIRLNRPAEAVDLIRRLLATTEPPAAADEKGQRQVARAYATLGRASLAAGRDQDALTAYLTVDLVHNQDQESHAEALFRLHELWNRGQYPQRANEAARRLETDYPKSSWASRIGQARD
jgi:tetratricopeptide (TPR) repeat protein